MTDETETVRTSLRLPKKLYDKLAAASEGKTMHAEILHRLEASFSPPRVPLDAKMGFLEDLLEQAISGIRRPRTEFELDVALAAVENKLRAGFTAEKTIARHARKVAKRKPKPEAPSEG